MGLGMLVQVRAWPGPSRGKLSQPKTACQQLTMASNRLCLYVPPPSTRRTWADQSLQRILPALVGGQAQPLARRTHRVHLRGVILCSGTGITATEPLAATAQMQCLMAGFLSSPDYRGPHEAF